MSEDTNPGRGRGREAEIRGGEAPDFGAMRPPGGAPDEMPPDPVPDGGPEPAATADGS